MSSDTWIQLTGKMTLHNECTDCSACVTVTPDSNGQVFKIWKYPTSVPGDYGGVEGFWWQIKNSAVLPNSPACLLNGVKFAVRYTLDTPFHDGDPPYTHTQPITMTWDGFLVVGGGVPRPIDLLYRYELWGRDSYSISSNFPHF